jgi:serine/threonine-protein kinase
LDFRAIDAAEQDGTADAAAKDNGVQGVKFRDIAELGKGGMGDVFLTVAPGPVGFNKLLVHKRLRPTLACDPEFLRIFLNEARLSARLNHANIVQTYEVGFDGSNHYIAMEYLDGQPLHRILRRARSGTTFTLEMQLRVLADMLAGLHYAHELCDYDGEPLAIIHRDISPANIFVCYDGQVKLVDFGIAKSTKSGETQIGVFKGKIQYVSPEQYRGDPLDRRADIYSTGVVLWEAATGRRMWKDAGDVTVIHRVATGDVPPPSSVNPGVPPRLEAICMKALALRPEDRYPTAAALQADIEAFLQERGARLTARDVGAAISPWFAEERAHLKVLIDDQMRAATDPDSVSLSPTVVLPSDTLTPVRSARAAFLSTFAQSRPSRRPVVALATGGVIALMAAFFALSPSPAPAPSTPSKAVAARSVPTPIAPPPSIEPAARTPDPTPAPSAPPSLKLTVDTVPENARVTVDGALLPADGRLTGFTRDNALHKVRAEAPGYRAKAEWVRFNADDIAVQLTLEPKKARKEPAPAEGAAGAAGTVEEMERRRDGEASRRAAPTRPIDPSDPWRK